MIKVTDLKTVLTAEQLNELEYQAEKAWETSGMDIRTLMVQMAEILFPVEMTKLQNLLANKTEHKHNKNVTSKQTKTMNATNTTEFAAVTTWISIADAKAKRAELIAQGIDKKQVKLSSYRWKNIKDHSEGYICRVLIVKGLRPELELADTKRVKKNKAAAFVTDCNTGNSVTDSVSMSYSTFMTDSEMTQTA